MKKMNVFMCFLCVFSLIISCISINSVQIVKGEKGDRGDRGQQGMAGINGKNGIDGLNGTDGKDGIDGLTPYIKDDYWWIGDTNTGYKVGELPCYVEVVEQVRSFNLILPNEQQNILNFCLNNDTYLIKVSYSQASGNCWYIPTSVNIGTLYKYSSTQNYNKVILKDIMETDLDIEVDEKDNLIVSYLIEDYFSLDSVGINAKTVEVYYTERQHIIQKVG